MKKSKTQKGITLIALIITIIILLILAVVAIGAVQNDGIIEYAKNARNQYQGAQTNEQVLLQEYMNLLNNEANIGGNGSGEGENDTETPVSLTGPWTQNKTVLTNANGDTINVGDYVNYVSGVSGYTDANGWRVLGAENEKILLISTKSVKDEYEGGVTLGSSTGLTELNTTCEEFGAGQFASEDGARSIEIEDIDRIAGYVPETYGKDTINEYGNEVTYTLAGTRSDEYMDYNIIEYSGTNGVTGTAEQEIFVLLNFELLDGTTQELSSSNPITVKSTYYTYDPASLIGENSTAYKMIFKNENDSDYTSVWLNSSCVNVSGAGSILYYRYLSGGGLSADSPSSLLDSGFPCECRAVVTLESDVVLTANGESSWTLSKPAAE